MFNGQIIIKKQEQECLYCSLIEIVSGNNPVKQSGAVEACWAHNPEVRGSKPRSARDFFFFFFFGTHVRPIFYPYNVPWLHFWATVPVYCV